MGRWRPGLAVLSVGCLLALATSARAQRAAPAPAPNEINVSVNYVYAAQLGFGSYNVGGLSVSVYSLPLEYTLRDVLLDWRLKIGLPLLYGTYDFNKTVLGDNDIPVHVHADQKTLSAEPKLKLEIPIVEPWTLSLIGAWGFGSTLDTHIKIRAPAGVVVADDQVSNQETWYYTYQVGISSLLQQRFDQWTLSLGNAFIYAGTAALEHEENVQAYGALETGVDARHPMGFRVMDYAPDASVFFIWYYFTPSLEFSRVERASLQVDNVYEVGLTFGADPETPFRLPMLGNPRLGASYRVGNDLNAVRLNFGFPF